MLERDQTREPSRDMEAPACLLAKCDCGLQPHLPRGTGSERAGSWGGFSVVRCSSLVSPVCSRPSLAATMSGIPQFLGLAVLARGWSCRRRMQLYESCRQLCPTTSTQHPFSLPPKYLTVHSPLAKSIDSHSASNPRSVAWK